jgi:hypothetical protein
MYKRILAKVLAERYVQDRGWSEERAIDFGRQVLRTNVEQIFRFDEEAPTFPGEPELVKSLSRVGTLADEARRPTEQLPGMAEFTYWPQATSEEGLDDFKLADPGEPVQEPAAELVAADYGEVDLVEEQANSDEAELQLEDDLINVAEEAEPAEPSYSPEAELVGGLHSSKKAQPMEDFPVLEDPRLGEEERISLDLEETDEVVAVEEDYQLEDEDHRRES